jgi:hypothetical protein
VESVHEVSLHGYVRNTLYISKVEKEGGHLFSGAIDGHARTLA